MAVEFESVAKGQVDAWNTHDLDVIRQLYTEDIVHHDGYPCFVGIDDVMYMAKSMMIMFPKFEGRLGGVYIGRQDGIGVWEGWNLFGYTKGHPSLEYDLLETVNGRISYWTLFYTQELMEKFSADVVNTRFLENFASTWSSGDPQAVASLYTQDATREDTLFKERQQGQATILAFAANFFALLPGARWELLQPFGETSPGKVQGGVYAIHVSDQSGKPCGVQTLLLLELSEEGILSERAYYDADSLVACNWAR